MFALFEVRQLCLVPLSFLWTLLIYPQTGEQVNPAQQRRAGTAFSFEDFSQWRMSVSSRRSREITLTWCIVHGARVRGGGALNLSKSCRLWGTKSCLCCLFSMDILCLSVAGGPRHTHPGWWKWGWASNHDLFTFALKMRKGNVLIAVYLYACVRVIRINQKVLNRIAWNLVGWLVIIRGPFD